VLGFVELMRVSDEVEGNEVNGVRKVQQCAGSGAKGHPATPRPGKSDVVTGRDLVGQRGRVFHDVDDAAGGERSARQRYDLTIERRVGIQQYER
jgi:hypothetical protein